jgi:hypothetical protein
VFTFLTVQFYADGPSGPWCWRGRSWSGVRQDCAAAMLFAGALVALFVILMTLAWLPSMARSATQLATIINKHSK